jgi:hypothetical protein
MCRALVRGRLDLHHRPRALGSRDRACVPRAALRRRPRGPRPRRRRAGFSSSSSTAITAAPARLLPAHGRATRRPRTRSSTPSWPPTRAARRDGPIRLKAWLYTIARNRCLSVLRAQREQVALDDGHAASDGLAADVDRRAELRGLVADLERLPDEQRAALVLFELGDHSHDEIAEVLGVRRDKVKALVFQARESLAGWRRARETPCGAKAAAARAARPPAATLRRHVARCEDSLEFEAEVRRQRADAGALPVVPAAG